MINAAATRCKHCHADLGAAAPGRRNPLKQFDTFKTGFLSGLLFALLIVILLYLQFWSA